MAFAVLARVLEVLVELALEAGHGQRPLGHTERRERPVDDHRIAAARELEPHVVVHRVAEALVEPAELAQDLGADEGRGGGDEVLHEQRRQRVVPQQCALVRGDRLADLAVVLVDDEAHAGEPLRVGMLLEPASRLGERVGQVEVVGVQPPDDAARCHRDALVHRIGQAPIGLRDEPHAGRLAQQLDGPVGRTAVDDDVLDVWMVLLGDAAEGAPDRRARVQSRRDDADPRHEAPPSSRAGGGPSRPRAASTSARANTSRSAADRGMSSPRQTIRPRSTINGPDPIQKRASVVPGPHDEVVADRQILLRRRLLRQADAPA